MCISECLRVRYGLHCRARAQGKKREGGEADEGGGEAKRLARATGLERAQVHVCVLCTRCVQGVYKVCTRCVRRVFDTSSK